MASRARVAGIVWVVLIVAAAGGLWWEQSREEEEQVEESASLEEVWLTPRQVSFFVGGDAERAALTWSVDGQVSQDTDRSVESGPVRLEASYGDWLYFSAQNLDSGEITCRIVVDGEVVASNSSSGAGAIVTCEAPA